MVIVYTICVVNSILNDQYNRVLIVVNLPVNSNIYVYIYSMYNSTGRLMSDTNVVDEQWCTYIAYYILHYIL